jgi:hypothetical protein
MGGFMSNEYSGGRYDDLVLLGTARAGGTAPNFAQIGATGIYAWQFVNNDELFFYVQLPHAWDKSAIYPHVHWHPSTSATYTGSWGLSYVWQNPASTSALSSVETPTASSFNASLTANQSQNNDWGAITLTNATISALMIMRLSLTLTAGTACILTGVDIHYKRNKHGTIAINTEP